MRFRIAIGAFVFAVVVVLTITAGHADMFSRTPLLPALRGATTWINSPALMPSDLRGKVVLVDFWTYTCINWLRTLPYRRAWAEKYREQGLVVVGVHSPEFTFEKHLVNVQRAVLDMNIHYPVAVDNEHAIWRGFGNQYWPALYLIDATGKLRHQHFGEGNYEQTEQQIQQLLREAGGVDVPTDVVKATGQDAEVAADWDSLQSGENYLGTGRTRNFASAIAESRPRRYAIPAEMGLNGWALAGEWQLQREFIALRAAGGKIATRFHARDLHLVMGPAAPGKPVRFRVLIDGKPPGAAHGSDVDENGHGAVTGQRLYQLIRQPAPVRQRVFEIEFLDAGIEAFAFTFG
jgi:thiol-disulfide isomerase/thioredoxin